MKRKRVSREMVKQNAADNKTGDGFPWLRLPKGITEWHPEKSGKVRLDFLPYVVSEDGHPDRIEKDTIWYKLPFSVHRSIGVLGESVVCPGSRGLPCPICEERARLAKNWDENEEACRSLSAQKWVAYNVLNPEDTDKVSVFMMSRGKFAEMFEAELMEGSEDNVNFYDVTKDGRTVEIRFSEDEYNGRKYLKATRIDFSERDVMDEDGVLEAVACLDKILHIESYKDLKKKFRGESNDESSGERDIHPSSSKSETKFSKPQKKSKPVVEDDDEVEEEDELERSDADEDDEETSTSKPLKKSKDKKKGKFKSSSKAEEPESEDEDEFFDELDEEDESDDTSAKPSKKGKVSPKKPRSLTKDEESDDEEDED